MRFFCGLILTFFLTLAFVEIHAQDDDPVKVDSSIVRVNVGVVDQKGKEALQMWYLNDKGVSIQNEIVNLMLDIEE